MTKEQAERAAANIYTQVLHEPFTGEYWVAVYDGDGFKIGEIRDNQIDSDE